MVKLGQTNQEFSLECGLPVLCYVFIARYQAILYRDMVHGQAAACGQMRGN